MTTRRPFLEESAPDLLPLIAIAFLIIAFFLLGLGAAPEPKVEVSAPAAGESSALPDRIVVSVSSAGTVHIDGKRIDLGALRPSISRQVLARPRSEVLVVAEEAARAAVIARVVDECRQAGATDIAFAVRPEGARHDAAPARS